MDWRPFVKRGNQSNPILVSKDLAVQLILHIFSPPFIRKKKLVQGLPFALVVSHHARARRSFVLVAAHVVPIRSRRTTAVILTLSVRRRMGATVGRTGPTSIVVVKAVAVAVTNTIAVRC